VTPLDVDAQIHRQSHRPRRQVAAVVAGERDEIDRAGNGEPPGEICEKHVRAPQHPYQEQVLHRRMIV
jgi:hypothetical protein